jgi:hypothetical protein
MYKEKFSGIICKINSIDISCRAELEMDELNRAILIIHKVIPEIAKNLEDNEDKNTIILQLDNDNYLCIFGAYVRRATYSTRFVENVPEDTTAEVILLSTSMINGKRIFSEKDRFKKFRFEITSGHELIGKCPFDLNTGYGSIQRHEKVEIPMECKHISIDTILGKLDFEVFPRYWFKRESFSIGFSHCIFLTLRVPILISDFHRTLKQITDFFSLLCGEQVTINKLSLIEENQEEIDIHEYLGYCNFKRNILSTLDNSGMDTNNFKSISIFKVTDFPDLKEALNYWFEHYEALYNAQQAYSRILLDENLKIVTVNKYLAAMQLIEGYSQAYVDEKEAVKDFKKRKEEIIAKLQDEDDKDYIETGLMMPGITFREAIINYYLKGISIFKIISEEKFNESYKTIISKIVSDRNFYTHSSKRIKPKLNFDELMDIAAVTKELYRCLVLNSMGIGKELICYRFCHSRKMQSLIYKVFQIETKIDGGLPDFDREMYHFFDPKDD